MDQGKFRSFHWLMGQQAEQAEFIELDQPLMEGRNAEGGMPGRQSGEQFWQQAGSGSRCCPLIQVIQGIGGPGDQLPDWFAQKGPVQFAAAQSGLQPLAQVLKAFSEGIRLGFKPFGECS
jgi:hypothetical protein